MGLFNKVLHAGEGRKLKLLQSIVPEVNALEPEMERRSDEEIRALTAEFRARIDAAATRSTTATRGSTSSTSCSRRRSLPSARPGEANAGPAPLRRADHGRRGAALRVGRRDEDRRGQDARRHAAAYLNALAGYGVHLVTVNDYLAKRDAAWMGQIYQFLGLEVGIVAPGDRRLGREEDRVRTPTSRTARTTSSGSTTSATTWRRRAKSKCSAVTAFAIIDEVDSILVDEARTPLIISGRADDAQVLYSQFARIVAGLQRERDYEVDEAKRTVVPTEEGIGRVEEALEVTNLYDHVNQNFVHQLQAALRAKELFKRDVDYVVADGEVKIVDEFTGRILEGRRWSEGLHQAVEAKEGVRVKEENQTLATVTLQNYFRMYDKLAGMTGTATTEAGEFAHTYGLEVVSIPTNASMVRADYPDLIYKTEAAQVRSGRRRHPGALRDAVSRCSSARSRSRSRSTSSALLQRRGIPHAVLNAKQHEQEAHVVTQAGRPHAVTVATNMAGRGVDILLGGQPGRAGAQRHARRGQRHPKPTRSATASWSASTRSSATKRVTSVREARRPLRARNGAAREPAHRQPAARSRRASGRPGREPLLPLARRRPHATLRDGRDELGNGSRLPRRHAPRSEDGHEGDRARAAHGRGSQLRDPQGRPQVRRGDERAAKGDLPAPPADPRRRGSRATRRSKRSRTRSTG